MATLKGRHGTHTVHDHPGTPGLLRSLNDAQALSLLIEKGPLTRAQIHKLTGLSKPTTSEVVARLERAGLVADAGTVPATRGPNAVRYAATVDGYLGVAIDVRPDKLLATVVDPFDTAQPVATLDVAHSAQRDMAREVTAAIAAACEAAGLSPANVRTFTIALQGSVDPATGDLAFADPIPGWPAQGMQAELSRHFTHPFRLENDANLAAIAERAYRPDSVACTAVLWIGSGIRLTTDMFGTLHRGSVGGAGEIGYLPMPGSTTHAASPAPLTLQDLIGGAALASLVREHGRTIAAPDAAHAKADNAAYNAEDYDSAVAALARGPARDALLAELAPRIADGVSQILWVLDPDVVILAGPTGAAGGPELADLVGRHIANTTPWRTEIAATRVPDQPVIRGARALVASDLRTAMIGAIP